MNILKNLGLVSTIIIMAFAVLNSSWNIDPNYSIRFNGNKAAGTFSGLRGQIIFTPNELASSLIDVTVDANTIKTGNETKDKHAKGQDWFDVKKYPYIKFTSSSFSKSGDTIIVSGILELHGIKKNVQIPFAFSESGSKANFTGNFKVNRRDYGIKGNFFGFTVGNEFEVKLNIPVTK